MKLGTVTKKYFSLQHDPENNKVCVPGGEDGNYIMFARATSGDKTNNRKFSPCSLKSVKKVLTAKARGPKGCFIGTPEKMAFCKCANSICFPKK